MIEQLARVREQLGPAGAAQRAADHVLDEILRATPPGDANPARPSRRDL